MSNRTRFATIACLNRLYTELLTDSSLTPSHGDCKLKVSLPPDSRSLQKNSEPSVFLGSDGEIFNPFHFSFRLIFNFVLLLPNWRKKPQLNHISIVEVIDKVYFSIFGFSKSKD